MTVQCGCKSPSRGRSGREEGADPRAAAAAADLVADHTPPGNTKAPRQRTAQRRPMRCPVKLHTWRGVDLRLGCFSQVEGERFPPTHSCLHPSIPPRKRRSWLRPLFSHLCQVAGPSLPSSPTRRALAHPLPSVQGSQRVAFVSSMWEVI